VAITLTDIREAADLIAPGIEQTPCAHSLTLSEITGAEVFLKFENLQFTGAFKERGALFKLLSLTPEERKAGVVAMSAGNHAQAVAYHAQRLGIPAVIVMPRFTPNVKVEHTRAFGAEVVLYGADLEEASAFTLEIGRERGLTLVHPYDDKKIIAGQGTIALEMLETYPDLEVIFVPIGGGGLIAGVAIAAKSVRPDIEIVGVETANFPSMLQTMRGLLFECGRATIAEGIAVKKPGQITLALVTEWVDEILLVDEDAIEASVLMLLEVEKTVVEGAGAVGLAALLNNRERFKGRKIGLILSGGNIDLLVLSSIIQRGLVRSGRLVRLRVSVPDMPGALAEVTQLLGNTEANIVEIRHQRAFTNLSLSLAEVEFVLHTRGLEHVHQIRETLARAQYRVYLPDRDVNLGA
jgi:threonine dehydratase